MAITKSSTEMVMYKENKEDGVSVERRDVSLLYYTE